MSAPVSPCTSVCVLDPATGWCKGCFRTIEEIAAWPNLTDEEKRLVLTETAGRRGGASATGIAAV